MSLGKGPEVDQPIPRDVVVKLQSAIESLATALIELDVAHRAEARVILNESLNSTLNQSSVLRATFFKELFDASEITFLDELIKNIIVNGQTAHTERSKFRQAVLLLVKKYRNSIHYRSSLYPYDLDGLIERKTQLTRLERADVGIPYPDRKSIGGFSNAYPDEEFVEVVEGILSSGKRYYSYFLDAAFNDFLDELHELNEKRKTRVLGANVDTPFSSTQTQRDLVKILAVAYNKLTKDFDTVCKASFRSKETSYLMIEALVRGLKRKIELSTALLTDEQKRSFEASLRRENLKIDDENTSNGESVFQNYLMTGDQSKRIKAEVEAVWEAMKKYDYASQQAAQASHQLLPLVQAEKEQLEKDNSELTRELAKAQAQCHSMSQQINRLKAEKRQLTDDNAKADASYQEELAALTVLNKKQLEAQQRRLAKLLAALAKLDQAKLGSNLLFSQTDSQSEVQSDERMMYEAQIHGLQQEIQKLQEVLTQAKHPPSRRRLQFKTTNSDASVDVEGTSSGKLNAQVGAKSRFSFSDEEESSEELNPKLVGSFTPPEKSGSSFSCE